jgi:hypothetical protein
MNSRGTIARWTLDTNQSINPVESILLVLTVPLFEGDPEKSNSPPQ